MPDEELHEYIELTEGIVLRSVYQHIIFGYAEGTI